MIGHLFYLKDSCNFLYNIQLKIFLSHNLNLFSLTQLNFFLTQLKFFSHTTKIFSYMTKIFSYTTEIFSTQVNFFKTLNISLSLLTIFCKTHEILFPVKCFLAFFIVKLLKIA